MERARSSSRSVSSALFLRPRNAAQPHFLLGRGVLLGGVGLIKQVQLRGVAVQPMLAAHDVPAKIGRQPDEQGRGMVARITRFAILTTCTPFPLSVFSIRTGLTRPEQHVTRS